MVGDSLRLFEIWKGDERLRQIPPFSYPPLTVCDRPSIICLAHIAGGLWTPISQSRVLLAATWSAGPGRASLRGLSACWQACQQAPTGRDSAAQSEKNAAHVPFTFIRGEEEGEEQREEDGPRMERRRSPRESRESLRQVGRAQGEVRKPKCQRRHY
jgi:hypothetical protein